MPMFFNIEVKVDRDSGRVNRLKLNPEVLRRLEGLDLSLQVHDVKLVAGGAFSDVAYGWLDGLEGPGRRLKIAVKRMRFHRQSINMKLLFEKEIYVWSKLHHKNILPLLGYAFDEESGCPLLISAWMERGTAWNYVQEKKDDSVLPLVEGIANGLHYLHGIEVVHSDLQGTNVLVSNSEPTYAMICDFGTARMSDPSLSLARPSSRTKGTVRWLSPELLLGEGLYSKEADVWAFGMTVYELTMRAFPYYHHRLDPQVRAAVINGEIPQYPQLLPSEPKYFGCLKKICELCWNHDLEKRVDMSGVLRFLQSYIQNTECSEHSFPHYQEQYNQSGLTMTVDRRFQHASVTHAIFSLDGSFLAVGCGEAVYVYSIVSGEIEWALDHKARAKIRITSLCFGHDPIKMVTFCSDHFLRIWEQADCKLKLEIKQGIRSLAFSPYDRFLAIGLENGDTYIRNTVSGSVTTLNVASSSSGSAIVDIAVSSNSRLVATSSKDGTVRIWEPQKEQLLKEMRIKPCSFGKVAFVGSNLEIITGSQTKISRWEVSKATSSKTTATVTSKDFCGHKNEALSVAVSHDRKLIASGSKDGTVRIWLHDSSQVAETLIEHRDPVLSVEFSPSGGRIVTASRDGYVTLWKYDAE